MTAWVERIALISFGVQDGDNLIDSMVIRSVSLQTIPVSKVPLPNSLVLMASSLAILYRQRRVKGV